MRFLVRNSPGNPFKWIYTLSLMQIRKPLATWTFPGRYSSHGTDGHVPVEVAKNSTVRRKIERLHFFRPPRNRGQEQHFLHSFPGIHARPLPHPYGRESARDHSESTALASPLRQAAAEVRICYSINSIADPDLLTAARKSRPNRKKFGRHLLRPPRLSVRRSPFGRY